jgi:uncharacterized membrane protein YfcA
MTAILGIAGILLASFIKGAIGFGFPAVSTPLLALFMDVKEAVAILILPNLVMDGIQALRRQGIVATLRRHAILYVFGIGGTFVGTKLLALVASRHALLILGGFILVLVAVNASRLSLSVRPGWEWFLSPCVGLIGGVFGGITNVQGPPLVLYFYALGLEKGEFVRSISISFFVYKLAQLAAVIQVGLMTWPLFGLSVLASGLSLGTFWLGLRIQDRVPQAIFNRAILGFLALLGGWLVFRALS